MSRSSKLVTVLFLVILGVVLVLRGFGVYTDFLWFGELGKIGVIKTMWATRLKLALVVGVLWLIWLLVHLQVARRLIPKDVTILGQRLLPDAERAIIDQHIDKVLIVVAIAAALLAGLGGSAQWLDWLKFTNGVEFGRQDPLFQKDVAFYLFRLPFLLYIWKTAFYAAVIGFVLVVLVHLYNESIRVHGTQVFATRPARVHALSLLALAFVLKGVGYYLARYTLLFAPSGAVPGGPGYAAVHYRMPVFDVQWIACIVAAIICLATIWLRNLRVPAFALVGVILLAILGGTSFPAIMEHLQVRPNALSREPEFIAHNIAATNQAYGLDRVVDQSHPIAADLTPDDIDQHPGTIENVRIWDDRPLQYTYRQQQALRQYYEFARVDLDRYEVRGRLRQVSVSARQLDYDRVGAEWQNRHLQYTHGYGVCMSPVNLVNQEGLPRYWIRDFPPRLDGEAVGEEHLTIDEPGLYFMENVPIDPYGYGELPPPRARGEGGEGAEDVPVAEEPQPADERKQARRDVQPLQRRPVNDDYVIVKSGLEEIDYPADPETGDTMKTVYAGSGGVPVSGLFRRLAFTARFTDLPILFYRFGRESRIIYNRWVPERITALAPFLFPDSNPYPVIHEGRIFWIVDAYTAAARYPYSTAVVPGRPGQAPNYVRNSVKVVVDSYNGTTTLYAWDPDDPLLQTYQRIFPGLFTPKEEMPENLRKHVRYPRDLFEIQSVIYSRYHVESPVTFFQNEDAWSIPYETLAEDERLVEPYYVLMSLPGTKDPEFMLIRPFTPIKREKFNMIAWMCARCDGDKYGELRLYRFPKVELSYGPMQIEARISQNEWLANFFNWKAKANRIIRGHLLVIPVGPSLIYVEPIYLESKLNPVPELSLVVVASPNRLGYGTTLSEALDRLFSGEAASGTTLPAEAEAGEEPGTATAPPPALTTIADLAERISTTYQEAEDRRMAGDFAGYASKVRELGPLIEDLQERAGGRAE